MTYPQGYQPQYGGGYGAPNDAYSEYSFSTAPATNDNAQRANIFWMTVAVLGLVTFGVSFGAPKLLDWVVWFSVLAAAITGVGWIPGQDRHGWLVAAFAVTGFLSGLSMWIKADGSGWAMVVVVVVNALQAIAAVAALVLEGNAKDSASDSGPDYAAYTQYAQAYQAYAMQYQQQAPPQTAAAGQGTAYGQGQSAATADARGTAGTRGQAADAAQESYEALQERYAQYGGYPPAPQQRGSAGAPAAAAGPDPGIPSYGHGGAQSAPQAGAPNQNSGEASSN